jgi:hypothetical protein
MACSRPSKPRLQFGQRQPGHRHHADLRQCDGAIELDHGLMRSIGNGGDVDLHGVAGRNPVLGRGFRRPGKRHRRRDGDCG